jgi:hypothetical protein
MLRRLRHRTRLLLPLGLAIATFAPPQAATAADPPTLLERRVKAAFIYKFAAYVDWPGAAFHGSDDPLVIGVIGEDAMAAELERLVEGRRSGGRAVQIRRIEDPAAPGNVHLLFVGHAASARLPEVAGAIDKRPVLLISETAGALGQGSMINFVLDEGRVRFEVDLDAVQKNGLGLSSRLLAVARSVTMKRS